MNRILFTLLESRRERRSVIGILKISKNITGRQIGLVACLALCYLGLNHSRIERYLQNISCHSMYFFV